VKNSNIDDDMILNMFESDRIFSFISHSSLGERQGKQSLNYIKINSKI
jgi:hypothetical protein